jgi:hypothetical protein
MKGQISIEYLIALSIFIGLISYIYLKYVGNISPFIEDVIKEEKRAEAFQIANILVNDPGEPVNWDSTNVKRVGLANESTNMTNWIKLEKINRLKIDSSRCLDLNSLLSIERPFNVLIFDVNPSNGRRTLLASCMSPVLRIDQINATVRRYAVYDGGRIAEIIVQV